MKATIIILAFISLFLLIAVIRLLYRRSTDRQELEKLQRQYKELYMEKNAVCKKYDHLYVENQNICKRLENSITYFKQEKAIQKELKEKNHYLKELLKAEEERRHTLSNIEITSEFIEAKRLIYKTDAQFIFISGGAGTGKSFFINNLLDRSENTAFIAPTGLAARNIKGKTIHSFFGFSIKTPFACRESISRFQYVTENYDFLRKLKILVIDEISMVRSDMLDLICAALMLARNDSRLFGGVKIVAVGDLYQLPPVVDEKKYSNLGEIFSAAPEDVIPWERWRSCWFFDAQCLKSCKISFIEFTKQFRQSSDVIYANYLNEIRSGFSDKALAYFNQAHRSSPPNKHIPRIFNHKKPALNYNEEMLDHLPGKAITYEAVASGIYTEYNESDLPVPLHLKLKPGASVMFVRNSEHWQNGTLGVVVSLNPDSAVVRNLDNKQEYLVYPETWSEYNQEGTTCIGRYEQLPLILAWAFNVHKMQGLTFDQIVYNPSGWVLPGMIYVALSRTRSLNGLYLEAPLNSSNIQQNGLVREFYNQLREKEKNCQEFNKSAVITSADSNSFLPFQHCIFDRFPDES